MVQRHKLMSHNIRGSNPPAQTQYQNHVHSGGTQQFVLPVKFQYQNQKVSCNACTRSDSMYRNITSTVLIIRVIFPCVFFSMQRQQLLLLRNGGGNYFGTKVDFAKEINSMPQQSWSFLFHRWHCCRATTTRHDYRCLGSELSWGFLLWQYTVNG